MQDFECDLECERIFTLVGGAGMYQSFIQIHYGLIRAQVRTDGLPTTGMVTPEPHLEGYVIFYIHNTMPTQ